MFEKLVKSLLTIVVILCVLACGDENTDGTSVETVDGSAVDIPVQAAANLRAKVEVEDKSQWKVIYTNSEMKSKNKDALKALDGDEYSFWHTVWGRKHPKHPHELQVDLGKEHELFGFTYQPRINGSIDGTVKDYQFFVSNDTKEWREAVAAGEFKYVQESRSMAVVYFDKSVKGRYFRFVALSEVNGKDYASCAEINVIVEE